MQDIQNRSSPEYALIQLKFLEEEKNILQQPHCAYLKFHIASYYQF